MKNFIKQKLHEGLIHHHVSNTTMEQALHQKGKSDKNYGYHAGNLKHKSERLSDRNYIIGKTGQMGTGYYFYGNINDAKKHATNNIGKIGEDSIQTVDFSAYNMFKPNNPNEFYDGLVVPLNNEILKQLSPYDFKDQNILDTLYDAADFYRESGVNIDDETFIKLAYQFVSDLTNKSSSSDEMFNNRILKSAGYEGVDVRGTSLDNFAVGSVIFELKPDTIKQLS